MLGVAGVVQARESCVGAMVAHVREQKEMPRAANVGIAKSAVRYHLRGERGYEAAVDAGPFMASMKATRRMPENLADQIVDAALALAEEVGWDNVGLRVLAERLDTDMAAVAACFRDRDAIADAWFARARAAMLAPVEEGFRQRPTRERLFTVMMRWFDALAPHRRLSVEMLKVKLWSFHPHHWVPMLFELSRTVLWWRDAAGLDSPPPRREAEEVGLTWLFLATLAVWSRDDTEGQERTRRFLAGRLADVDRLSAMIPAGSRRTADAERP